MEFYIVGSPICGGPLNPFNLWMLKMDITWLGFKANLTTIWCLAQGSYIGCFWPLPHCSTLDS
ncbi:hypothetical protein Gotur_028108 [Gossypium turneri]